MYTILMNNDKTLIQTVRENLLQRENMMNKLCFLIPLKYGDVSLMDANVVLEYTDPTNTVHADILEPEEDIYKEGYIRYFVPVSTLITQIAGDVELRLSLSKLDVDTMTQYVLHTYPTTIKIHQLKDLYNIEPNKSFDFIDRMMIALDAKIKALDQISGTYSNNLPYDLDTDENSVLHLVTRSNPLAGTGVPIYIPDEDVDGNPNDGVINLDNINTVNL